jgi:hypothetical protein
VKRFFLTIALLGMSYVSFLSAQTPALEALKPEQSLSGFLHTGPSEETPKFRELQPTDQIRILRNEGEWYEVDVTSEKGVDFRGWVKGGLPTERKKPTLGEEQLKAEKLNPLKSDRYLWFWSGEVEETARLGLLFGTENINYSPKGTPAGAVEKVSGYNFWGFSLGAEASLTLLETQIYRKEFRWLLDGNYQYGFFQVAFGNSPALPGDIQGASYRIHSQKFQIESKGEFRLTRWNRGFLRAKFGGGYLSYDDSPDLRRTSQGNVVFTQMSLTGLTTPLEFEAQFANNYRGGLYFTPLWLPTVSESPDASAINDLKSSGLNWMTRVFFQYRWTERFSLQAQGEYFKGSAKHPGRSRRINADFDDVKIDLTSLRMMAGVNLHF